MFGRDNKLVLVFTGILVGVWLGVTILVYAVFDGWPTRGQVGDTFGVVNSLFSGMALTFAAYALVLQAKELEAQRQERERQRRAAQLSAQPRLVGVGASYDEQVNDVIAENIGASATDVTVRAHRDVDVTVPPRLAPQASMRVSVKSKTTAALPDVVFTVDYTDANGHRGTQRYFLPKNTHFLSLLD